MTTTNAARAGTVLAIDIGTSSVRALAFDPSGRILARKQICYGTSRPRPYFEEQDPDLVRGEVYRAARELLGSGEVDPASIEAIAFSSQMYGIFPVDRAGKAMRNAILWSDGRAEPQAERLKRELGPLGLYPETGCPMNSIYPVAKLAWLREEEAEAFKAAARFVSIKEYVAWPLVGEWVVDHSMASGTGLLDVRRHTWHAWAPATAPWPTSAQAPRASAGSTWTSAPPAPPGPSRTRRSPTRRRACGASASRSRSGPTAAS
jgi:gluconokinase